MKKAIVSVIDKDTNTLISTISFCNYEKDEIEWLRGISQTGKVKFSITVKYEQDQ
jgi:hypothetical protein